MAESIPLAKPVRITPSPCPYCKYAIDAAAAFGPGVEKDSVHTPGEGDVTICGNCGNWLIYNANQTVRPMTSHEILDLGQEQFQALVNAGHVLVEMRQRKRQGPVNAIGRFFR